MIDEGERATMEVAQEMIKILNKKPKKKGILCKSLDIEYI
jgi:hypothetical protein